MGHYKSNLRDIEFNLFEVLGTGDKLGHGPFSEIDPDTARGILSEVKALAEGPLAASYVDSDRNPPVFDPKTNTVVVPDSFKKSYKAWQDAEWWRLETTPDYGGTLAPRSLVWSIAELVLGANPAIWMYNCGPAFANIIHEVGTAEQQKIGRLMIDRRWGATMVLTEPDAGSDVGAGRTKATQQADGTWHIEGVKRFITSGEHDMSDNIVHYVLARPEGAGPGTKGLSLFIVPKFDFDWDTGELGERNGAFVTNVEHKMGLKASTTCEVRFGETVPAKGWLLGEIHDGIAQMFKVIEHARMMVGTKAYSELSAGYLAALDYAKTRVQSADLTQSTDKTAPRVTIIHHPDVRRQLMTQKAYAEGLRAVALYTASVQDRIQIAEFEAGAEAGDVPAGGLAGGEASLQDKARRHASVDERLNDLLLPIVKGVGSERSYEQLGQALQVFGGSGFLQDYPLEQYIRDNKIDSLYEGTTAIQGQDFFFRKIVRDKGVALGALSGEIQAFLDSIAEEGRLKDEHAAVSKALAEVGTMVGAMIGQLTSAQEDIRNIYKVGQNTTRLLMSCGDLAIGWLLLRQAKVALDRLDGNGLSTSDKAFYEGKLAVARFFSATVLPELVARRKIVEATDNALMDAAEAVF
ncbi:acyl-CoA dehydrogenase [Jatrophihabitans telluris]|uniref:Acyl-CoA dehydrogenase n=1 Tax=Jatrophihabitans telluris TaxID=2038343 RepID=A0ABY4QYL5_9ACTN|nr:acyl-CoA dehydrogenase [Jatrophihabitans telluris]UQX88382.1 acyl-CoA dehydrogenase [Jatrophihabitans telluris]